MNDVLFGQCRVTHDLYPFTQQPGPPLQDAVCFKILQKDIAAEQGRADGIRDTELGIDLGVGSDNKGLSHHLSDHFGCSDPYFLDLRDGIADHISQLEGRVNGGMGHPAAGVGLETEVRNRVMVP